MSIDTKYYEDLYKEWMEQLADIDSDELIVQVSSVMRSKLTSIIGSGQILGDELKDLSTDASDQQELLEAIIASARYISTMLDAVVDMAHQQEQNNNSPTTHQ